MSEREKYVPTIHPCIWVRSSWYLEDGMPHSSECRLCGEVLPGARYVVNTYSGNSYYGFFCHDCERRREASRVYDTRM